MKRQTRPFVVEVKKRRGGLSAGKHSIWVGIDLKVDANEAAPSSPHVDRLEDSPPWGVTDLGLLGSEEQDAGAQADTTIGQREEPSEAVWSEADDDVRPVPVEPRDNEPKQARRRSRRHKEAVSPLPRSERWKRRLPAALLGRRKHGE